MDFIVSGLGFGALLVLAGYAVREIGSFLFAPTRTRRRFAEDPVLSASWRRFMRAVSDVVMGAGLVMWLVTLIAVIAGLSDQNGAYAVAAGATVISLVGAALVYLASLRLDSPVVERPAVERAAASAPTVPAAVEAPADAEPFEGWRPRIVPKPSVTFADDMPSWGAVYEPAPEAEAAVEPVAGSRPIQDDDAAFADWPAAAAPVETDVSAAGPPALADEPESVVAALPEASPEEAVSGPDPDLEPILPETDAVAISEPIAEPETAIVPAIEPPVEAPLEDQAGPAPRFKSSILMDLDETATADGNAKFRSSILADLSTVRLPDDGPRFRPTTLVDAPKPEKSEPDPAAKSNGRHG